jgi:hypothetical protein
MDSFKAGDFWEYLPYQWGNSRRISNRRPDVSDQEFAEDAKPVEKDLTKLKTLLEK